MPLRTSAFLAAAALLAAVGPARAEPVFNWVQNDTHVGLNGALDASPDAGTAWRLFGGRRFGPHAATEIGVVRLGRPTASRGIVLDGVSPWDLRHFGLATPWASRVQFLARVGLYVSRAGSDDGASRGRVRGLHVGGGAGWDLADRFSVQLEWERYNAATDVDVVSLGLLYRF